VIFTYLLPLLITQATNRKWEWEKILLCLHLRFSQLKQSRIYKMNMEPLKCLIHLFSQEEQTQLPAMDLILRAFSLQIELFHPWLIRKEVKVACLVLKSSVRVYLDHQMEEPSLLTSKKLLMRTATRFLKKKPNVMKEIVRTII